MDAKAYVWGGGVFISLRILAGLIYIAATTQPIRSKESNPFLGYRSTTNDSYLDYSEQLAA